MDHESAGDRTTRRIAAAQRWLATKLIEVRRPGFFGELTITLKFEEGQCVLGEHVVREKTR